MNFTTAAKNVMLNSLTLSHAQIEDNEQTAIGSRQAITVGAASLGSRAMTDEPEFAVGSGVTVASVSFWNQASGGTQQAAFDFSPAEFFPSAGTFVLTTATFEIEDSV